MHACTLISLGLFPLELQTDYTEIVCFVKGGTHWTHWALALESVLEALSKF
jgi:cystathionine beta-lyase family protein involved in aluminum resistance